MKVPLRWLSEFVETGLSPKELGHRLTMAGLQAEKFETIGDDWANVYVGLVKDVKRHPDADRLVLAEVEAGEHHLTVVTGAPNIEPGQKVALAVAGARLIDGYSEGRHYKTLKPGVIRGVRSEGMVCSEKELGLSDEHAGILVLDSAAPVGAPLADWLGDTVIEFEITPNLAHAFSIHGIAREAAAITEEAVHVPVGVDLTTLPDGPPSLVQIDAEDLCARYIGIVFEGVQVGPSPEWLARRLTMAGIRPINNVVDVTNYVMVESGQPLHAFDRGHLREGRIVVRRAFPGERIETLDHQERALTPEMLVIADADRAVALAGVIGGVDSEVGEATTEILLEGANFEMKSVRHTARALKVRTDASARFERGLDPNLVGAAMGRATRLLLEVCPGSRVTAVRDVYPQPLEPSRLTMPIGRIERLLGIGYLDETVLDVLGRLEFYPSLDGDRLTVTIPTYRRDVSIPEDIVEEVARIIGYDTLPSTLPTGKTAVVARDSMHRLKEAARATLVGAGAYETVTYVTVTDSMLRPFALKSSGEIGFVRSAQENDLVRLRNPLQADRGVMRPTLIPSLAEIAATNLKHQTGVRLVELARIYLLRGRDVLPNEIELAGILLAGQRGSSDRYSKPGELDFFDLKGLVDELLARLGMTRAETTIADHPALHPGRAAALSVDGRRVGLLGELRPDVATALGIEDYRVAVAEIDLAEVLTLLPERTLDKSVPRYLPVQQDFAIVVEESTPAGVVQQTLLNGAGLLATDVTLFDVYHGPQVGEGKKSLAYRVTFTAPDRALTDAELVKVRGRIERSLAQLVGGTLRG